MTQMKNIVAKFAVEGTVTDIKPLGPGFINDTLIVKTEEGPKYILQRKNHIVFPDVPGMMNNILMVTPLNFHVIFSAFEALLTLSGNVLPFTKLPSSPREA